MTATKQNSTLELIYISKFTNINGRLSQQCPHSLPRWDTEFTSVNSPKPPCVAPSTGLKLNILTILFHYLILDHKNPSIKIIIFHKKKSLKEITFNLLQIQRKPSSITVTATPWTSFVSRMIKITVKWNKFYLKPDLARTQMNEGSFKY